MAAIAVGAQDDFITPVRTVALCRNQERAAGWGQWRCAGKDMPQTW